MILESKRAVEYIECLIERSGAIVSWGQSLRYPDNDFYRQGTIIAKTYAGNLRNAWVARNLIVCEEVEGGGLRAGSLCAVVIAPGLLSGPG